MLRKSLEVGRNAGRRLVRAEWEAYSIDPSLASLDIDDLNGNLERAEHAAGWTKRHYLEAALAIGAAELPADEPPESPSAQILGLSVNDGAVFAGARDGRPPTIGP